MACVIKGQHASIDTIRVYSIYDASVAINYTLILQEWSSPAFAARIPANRAGQDWSKKKLPTLRLRT